MTDDFYLPHIDYEIYPVFPGAHKGVTAMFDTINHYLRGYRLIGKWQQERNFELSPEEAQQATNVLLSRFMEQEFYLDEMASGLKNLFMIYGVSAELAQAEVARIKRVALNEFGQLEQERPLDAYLQGPIANGEPLLEKEENRRILTQMLAKTQAIITRIKSGETKITLTEEERIEADQAAHAYIQYMELSALQNAYEQHYASYVDQVRKGILAKMAEDEMLDQNWFHTVIKDDELFVHPFMLLRSTLWRIFDGHEPRISPEKSMTPEKIEELKIAGKNEYGRWADALEEGEVRFKTHQERSNLSYPPKHLAELMAKEDAFSRQIKTEVMALEPLFVTETGAKVITELTNGFSLNLAEHAYSGSPRNDYALLDWENKSDYIKRLVAQLTTVQREVLLNAPLLMAVAAGPGEHLPEAPTSSDFSISVANLIKQINTNELGDYQRVEVERKLLNQVNDVISSMIGKGI
jgi:hypothetical protein